MSFAIDPKIHEDFKRAAAAQGEQMSHIIRRFIRQYIAKHLPASSPKTGGRK